MIPGKQRNVGEAYPGSERFERLVTERYNLRTMTGMERPAFLEAVNRWASKSVYEAWLAAYKDNAGSFLDHPCWGADRDLGAHFLWGAMDDRYATNAARVFVPGGLADSHVEGKRCCVVGAWDGTECLLLAAMGAVTVDAIEEVPAFVDMANLQYRAWSVRGRVLPCSLYAVRLTPYQSMDDQGVGIPPQVTPQQWQRYDLVYVPGVLYHLTDPVTALVMLWAITAPGGTVAIESVVDTGGVVPIARYLGPSLAGWNWWAPNAACFEQLIRDCGFPDAHTVETSKGRGWWVGTRGETCPAIEQGAAGFSRPELLRTIRTMKESP